jgi:hypothetical protein
MFEPNDWGNLNESERAYKIGYLISQYTCAIKNLNHCYLILSENIDNERIVNMAWILADGSVMTIFKTDLSVADKYESFSRFREYLPSIDIIRHYSVLRSMKKYESPVHELELIVKEALNSLKA